MNEMNSRKVESPLYRMDIEKNEFLSEVLLKHEPNINLILRMNRACVQGPWNTYS